MLVFMCELLLSLLLLLLIRLLLLAGRGHLDDVRPKVAQDSAAEVAGHHLAQVQHLATAAAVSAMRVA
jgi:hypothetical protein